MTTMHELVRSVQCLTDRDDIRQLVHRYCFSIDDHDFDTLKQCFSLHSAYRSVDGLFDVRGQDAIAAYFQKRMRALGPTNHITHGHLIELDTANPNRATGRVSSHAEIVADGVPMITCLRYDDVYCKEDETWRFEERVMSFMYYCPASDYLSVLKTLTRKHFDGHNGEADFPEKLPGWSGQPTDG